MQQFVGTSLKARLYLLILAAFVPVAVLIIFVTEEQKTIETDAILHRTMLLAKAAADAENQQMESIRNLLVIVSDALLVADGQADWLARLLAKLTGQTNGYAAVGVVGANGQLLAGSDPSPMDKTYSDRGWFKSSLEKTGMIIDRYHGERINGKPVLYFAQSVRDDSRRVMAVAYAALDLDWLNRAIFRQLAELPGGSRLTLLDKTQGMIRFDVDSARWSILQGYNADLQQQIASQPSGALMAADEDGTQRIYAFAQLESAFRKDRVSVVLEIPKTVAMASSKRTFIRNLTLLAISALVAILSIWWVADVIILRRVAAMVKASRRLAAGDMRARIGLSGTRDELNHLAGVFDDMAASLQMRIEREEQVNVSLQRSREQLRRLSAYQNEVREQERIRIAREIHDQLGQLLTVLKMDLSWINKHRFETDAALEEKISAMAGVIETAMDNLHAVTADLRPVMLDDFGLAAAIEWQAEAFTRRSGIQCRLENNGFEPDLPRAQATALFRIFQEIITNIVRHAQASEVVVHLEIHGDELFFQVVDNGRGIRTDEINAPDAFGLLGIRERLYPFDGRVAFEGQAGQGTRVTIHLPMPQEGEKQ
jgi:signal transduction histidine kinase